MLHLDYRDGRPLHRQVRDGLRRLMLSGVLQAGDQLPSVRTLATELAIGPDTIHRAYAQREAEGSVYSVAGRGSCVAEDGDQNARRMAELTASLRETIEELRHLGMTEQQWSTLWKEEERND